MCNNTASGVAIPLLLLNYLQSLQDSEQVAHKLHLFSEVKEKVKDVSV